MDREANERAREALPGLVSSPLRGVVVVRAWLAAALALSLLGGIAGGLTRAGIVLPGTGTSDDFIHAAVGHAALMICGFLGTVIGIERAVANEQRIAFLAPLSSGSGGVLVLFGQTIVGAWLMVAAALVFVVVNCLLVRRQFAPHTLLLTVGALSWFTGNVLFAVTKNSVAPLSWWFAFLVLTIGAERLEMTRLMPRRAGAPTLLGLALSMLLAGATLLDVAPVTSGLLYGAGLSLLALWLSVFDIARRTVKAHGLSRYMALCLLSGYAWLFVAGLAWGATALGWPARDVALHAMGLGFIFSMVMGHAPLILPSVARVKLHFGVYFYIPLLVLQLSLVLRLVGGSFDASLRAAGAALNAISIAIFAITIAGAAVAASVKRAAVARVGKVAS